LYSGAPSLHADACPSPCRALPCLPSGCWRSAPPRCGSGGALRAAAARACHVVHTAWSKQGRAICCALSCSRILNSQSHARARLQPTWVDTCAGSVAAYAVTSFGISGVRIPVPSLTKVRIRAHMRARSIALQHAIVHTCPISIGFELEPNCNWLARAFWPAAGATDNFSSIADL